MNRQNLWFLTLLSLIIVLGVYYITIPSNLLEKVEEEIKKEEIPVVEEVEENTILVALRVNLNEEREEKLEVLKEQLVSETISSVEKNNIYEQLKYLNEIQGKEEALEKKIKKEKDLDCFIKIENQNVSVVCVSNEHDSSLANSIMRIIQKDYPKKMNITVKFQKK